MFEKIKLVNISAAKKFNTKQVSDKKSFGHTLIVNGYNDRIKLMKELSVY